MSKTDKSGRPIRVVIADDHAIVRQGLRAVLGGGGIEVVGEAPDGAAAVEMVRALRPDVVLMDVQMPGMDGLEATAVIRKESPGTQVVMVTNYENHSYLRRAVQAGASGYVLKGSSRAAYVNAIRLAGGATAVVNNDALRNLAEEAGKRKEQPASERLGSLTALEYRVLSLIASGCTNTQIADELRTSTAKVRATVQSVFDKLGVSGRSAATEIALRAGLAAADDISDAAGS